MFAVVLVAPEIPPNTGNVIRLTANTATDLHLVEPLGFRMDDRDLRRAGLDYHEYARVKVHRDWRACREALGVRMARAFALTTRASRSLYDTRFAPGDVLVFGCETAGLPQAVLDEFGDESRLFIPMRPGVRSLNLSNAVAVSVYEAWRQQAFALPPDTVA
jgi:tRNA (cytidine/uridine-2'-O-)-methyltransferase